MTNQTGNGGSNSPQARAGGRRMDGAISTERLVMLAQATPEQQAQVDAILAGRVPFTVPPEPRMAPRDHGEVEPFLNKREVAERLGIKPRTCDQWMAEDVGVRVKRRRNKYFQLFSAAIFGEVGLFLFHLPTIASSSANQLVLGNVPFHPHQNESGDLPLLAESFPLPF